jgi:pyridoxine 5-phosphate synthase
MRLYVNIDHVATVRQARRTDEPDPVRAAVLAELGGADGITAHLREDRRHILDRDVRLLMATVRTGVNLELAASSEILDLACELRPMQATLVPEKREEITTEGGLALAEKSQREGTKAALARLMGAGVRTALFIDPEEDAIRTAVDLGADAVELHTGQYALASGEHARQAEVDKLRRAGDTVVARGAVLHAGHGLTYRNVRPVAELPGICELNIGHSIVARALWVGFQQAVREMKQLIA